MGWNRPSDDSDKAKAKKQGEQRRTRVLVRGSIAALVVVLGAALAWYFLFASRTPQTSRTSPSRSLIKEVKPVLASKPTPEKPKDPPGYWNGKKITNKNRPPWMSPYHRVVDYGPIHTNKPLEAAMPLYKKVFDDETDQCIASVLLVEPGQFMLTDGTGEYEDFDANFIDSLKVPIIVRADDPDDVKELKRAVIETKAELKARYDKGESLQKIMEETHRELRELGLYKEEIRQQVETLCEKQMFTEADVDDCIEAANKMLEDRGGAPLTMSKFYREMLVRTAKAHAERLNEGKEDEDEE